MLGAGADRGRWSTGSPGSGGGAALGRSPIQAPTTIAATAAAAAIGAQPRPGPAAGRRDGGPDVTEPVVGADRVGLARQGAAQLGLELLEPVGTRSVGHDAPPRVLRRVVRARWACALTEPGEMSSASAICRSLRSE